MLIHLLTMLEMWNVATTRSFAFHDFGEASLTEACNVVQSSPARSDVMLRILSQSRLEGLIRPLWGLVKPLRMAGQLLLYPRGGRALWVQ